MDKNNFGKLFWLLKNAARMCLLILLVILLTANPVLASGSSGGLVTVKTTVSGLADNSNITVTATKEIDGVLTTFTALTNLSGVAEISIPFGGTAEITAQAVPGYITPVATVSLTRVKGNFVFECSLVYLSGGIIPVTDISVSPAEVSNLIVGSTVQLLADIEPANATDQAVVWETSDSAIASVDSSGLVTALATGSALITAVSNDGGLLDSCSINVVSITGIQDLVPDPIITSPGLTTLLPESVQADLSSGAVMTVPVVWSLITETQEAAVSSNDETQYISLTQAAFGDFVLEGSISNSDIKASLTVSVTGDPIVQIESAFFEPESLTLYIGLDRDFAALTLISTPENADASAVEWISSDPGIAIIESISEDRKSATIRGLSSGYAIITAGIPGQAPLDSCLVTVADDPQLTDPAYIAATTENDPTPVDQFDGSDDVWIRCYNLPDGIYHIKITDKGTGLPLGNGTINVLSSDPDAEGPLPAEYKYHLKTAADFTLTSSYSASYFIYMSTDPDFPTGDDESTGLPKTFMDNFKIGSPVPTGFINVNVRELLDGTLMLPANLFGKHVILGREIKTQTIAETDYADYLLGMDGEEPVFSDEAKLIGHIQVDGSVLWETPKEKLKIGGYVLCMELPEGYESNLNAPDPNSDDGELVKEVHITRNKTVDKLIICWD